MRLALSALSLATLAMGAAFAGPAVARTFVYVSNAQDSNIDAYVLDKASGALTGTVPVATTLPFAFSVTFNGPAGRGSR